TYEVLLDELQYKLKRIIINPSHRISYQSHDKRNEIWVVVSGHGEITLDDKVSPVKYGSIISIPKGTKHRIENTNKNQCLIFVEVQTGESFNESDIIRYSDDYNRVEGDNHD
ncbi:MAG TPA: mannose-6-phosphate isomerase, partial [Maribacter sp.]|nr:mannose-6-phosphate isomerase [Maribacter sp.]